MEESKLTKEVGTGSLKKGGACANLLCQIFKSFKRLCWAPSVRGVRSVRGGDEALEASGG